MRLASSTPQHRLGGKTVKIQTMARRPGSMRGSDLPHARHKPIPLQSHNGGFMRVTEGWHFVAETAERAVFLSVIES